MITSKTIELIKKHEGLRLKPYLCTEGRTTIGYGRNIQDKGITQKEADMLLLNDLNDAERDARVLCYGFDILTEARQAALVDMALNLGFARLKGFKNFLAAVNAKNYKVAAEEMLDSRWAKQVGDRATELSELMKTGEWKNG